MILRAVGGDAIQVAEHVAHGGQPVRRQLAHTQPHLSDQLGVLGVAGEDVGVVLEGALVAEHPAHVNVQLVDAVRHQGLLQLKWVE